MKKGLGLLLLILGALAAYSKKEEIKDQIGKASDWLGAKISKYMGEE